MNHLLILGDTQLTLRHEQKNNPFFNGCLKQYIVNQNIAIAFAGNKNDFELDLNNILDCTTVKNICDIALKAKIENKHYDLIIADLKSLELIFIKNGVLEKQDSGFIGDSSAFNYYQGYFHNYDIKLELEGASICILLMPEPNSKTINDMYMRMYSCLREVCLNNKTSSVGGIIVPLCSHNGSFSYMNYVDSVVKLPNLENISSRPQLITYGTSTDGSYTAEFFGNGAKVGLYFLQGGFGIVFSKNNYSLLEPKILYAKTPAYWALETNTLVGEGFKSGFLNADNCGQLGETLVSQEKYLEARYCYELKIDFPELLGERKEICDRYIAGYAVALFNSGDTNKAKYLLQKWVGLIDNHKYIDSVIEQIKNPRN